MSLLLESDETRTMSLLDYRAVLDSYGDGLDEDALVDTRHAFAALLNNRTMLADALADDLMSPDFQRGNPWVGPSFVLARTATYTIRVNTWNPPECAEAPEEWENALYSYHLAHDHNFAFLTGGYHGPGYRTLRFEYDPEESKHLRVGDVPTTLVELEPAYLGQGAMMLYRESRDVHVQEHPQTMSLSLNVLLPGKRANAQILFSSPGGSVATVLGGQNTEVDDTVDRIARLFGIA
jgi:hypothetical protein